MRPYRGYARSSGIVELPVNRSHQFALRMARPGLRPAFASALRRGLLVAIFACAGPMSQLHAQSSIPAPAAEQTASATLPAEPSPPPAASNPGAAPSAPVPGLDSSTSVFGQDQIQNPPPVSSRSAGASFRQGSRFVMDPFQLGMVQPRMVQPKMDSFQPSANFGIFAGPAGSGMGFNGPGGFDAGRQRVGGFNPLGGSGMSERPGNLAPLFPAGGGSTGGASGAFGAGPFSVPSLNQLMRGSVNLPLSSSSSAFRFSYQEALRPGGTPSDFGRPSASALFTTSDLGNGMFLSAGTGSGNRSMAGAPAAGLGNGTVGGPKHSGPSVNLKLSF